jgi:folate-binding protein YgfZ
VVQLDHESSTLGAHCDAKGKMWSLFRLFQYADGYALWQHASGIEVALQEIKKYSVFSKVEMTISPEISLGILGEQADALIDSITETKGDVRQFDNGCAVKIDFKRWLLLVTPDNLTAIQSQLSTAAQVTEQDWDYFDIIQGLPRVVKSEQNLHIPQALNLQAVGGISFEKGCYTGQETVARAKYRGMNKRIMRVIQGSSSNNEPFNFERKVGDNWRGAGNAIAQYRNSEGSALALIIINKDLEEETEFRLSNEPEQQWQLLPLTYSIDD